MFSLTFFLFLFSFPLVSASKFGIGSRTNSLGINNYYINQTLVTVANGTGTFVEIVGDTMTGDLNMEADILPTTSETRSLGSDLLRWFKGWFVNLDASGNVTIAHKLTTKSANITNNLYIGGNLSVKRPYASLTDNVTQTIANTALAYPINFSHIEDAYLVRLIDGKNISVDLTGDYLIEVSALFTTTTGTNKHVELWLEKNGVNVDRSSTYVEIPTSGVDTVVTVPFIIDLNTTDQIRFMWNADTTAAQLISYPNRTAPTRPEVPSIILTMSKISEITE